MKIKLGLCAVLVVGCLMSGRGVAAQSEFDDVPPSHPFYAYVNAVTGAGFMSGATDEHFGVDDPLPRWSAAVILEHAAFGIFEAPTCSGTAFRDIGPGAFGSEDHHYCGFVEDLVTRRVTGGCGNGFFCPNDGTTRAQLAILIVRSLGDFDPSPESGPEFADVPLSYFAYAFIKDFGARRITQGCGGGNFCPERIATRGEMAVFVARAFLGFK